MQPYLTQRMFLKLCIMAPVLSAPALAESRAVDIDWGAEGQTIDGFGISGAFHQCAVLRDYPEPQRSQVLDLIFSAEQGAGFSILRNMIGDGGVWGGPMDGPSPSIEPQPGVWDWTGDEDQIWFMREGGKRGCHRFFSTVWSPPAWMKTNGSVTGGGRLRPDCYRAFAEYLAAYVKGYSAHHGIEIYAVSPANEPDQTTKYSSCLWSGEELRVLVRDHITPVFAREAITVKLVLGEHCTWSEEPYRPSLLDPEAAARIDIVASHAYTEVNRGFEPVALRSGRLLVAQAANKPVWQTEVSAFDKNDTGILDGLYWARLVHDHLTQDRVSGWFYWWAINTRDSRSALIRLLPQNQGWIAAKRLYTIGQFARFVRPGYRRVPCRSSPRSGAYVSAFRDPQALRSVIVAINDNDHLVEISFQAAVASAEVYRTSDSENLAPVDNTRAKLSAISVALAPRSVTSLVMVSA